MLVFDQLKKNDPQVRMVTLVVLGGLGVLLAGLWWVQVVCARDYQESLQTQSFRTVRIPAVRGRILDANGVVLAENQATYNLCLYPEELRKPIDRAYSSAVARLRADNDRKLGRKQEEKPTGWFAWAKQKFSRLLKKEKRRSSLTAEQIELLRQNARYEVASKVVAEVSQKVGRPVTLDPESFKRHYKTSLAFPYLILPNVDPLLIARFEEQVTSPLGVDLELQSTRTYPFQTTAAHVLGSLQRDNSSAEGEEAFFSYRLPDYRGRVGMEFAFDKILRGQAGAKAVLVNNLGYRQTENVWSSAEPGRSLVLTLDLHIQQAAERALQRGPQGQATRGAVVVMDVQTGDVLAMASSPIINPNHSVRGFPPGELQRRQDEKLTPEFNRATQGAYFPGSVFKLVVGLAALEAGLNPNEVVHVAPNPTDPGHGAIFVEPGHHKVRDTAAPGNYNFRRALLRSSNSYFVTHGLRLGPEGIVRMAQRFHLGEPFGLNTRQEASGFLPSLKRVSSGWVHQNTANLSIGQDPVKVTPLQVAVLTSAIANGGKVLWPRLVDRVESLAPGTGEPPCVYPHRPPRDNLGVHKRNLEILHEAMLADTEDPEGTGEGARVPDLRICGKTGTAQVQDEDNNKTGQKTWFASFAPYERPRWAVVVMVEDGASGGTTCAPMAREVYAAIVEREHANAAKTISTVRPNKILVTDP